MPLITATNGTSVSLPSGLRSPPSPVGTSDDSVDGWAADDSFSPAVARPDPLAVTAADGTSFPPVNGRRVAPDMVHALSEGADVPARVQDGPTCGLYALGMVMDYFDEQDPGNLNPLVQTSDLRRPDSHSRVPDTDARLLEVARQLGYTTRGEMFWADNLADLAQRFGYRAVVHPNLTLADIQRCVDRHHPALVPFDVDNAGNPGLFDGMRAHWAVIEGYFQKDGVDYVVATHGWTGKEYVWRAADLMASVNQLNHSDTPGAPRDITQTLKGRLVEVFPQSLG